MSADSTSAARERARAEAVRRYRPNPSCVDLIVNSLVTGFQEGAQWARSQPRVVSGAAVEAALEAFAAENGTSPHDWMVAALQAAYAVEEQQK